MSGMSERYSREQVLEIAEQLLQDDYFDGVTEEVGVRPFAVTVTVAQGRSHYKNDKKIFEDKIKPKIIGAIKENEVLTAVELSQKLGEAGVKIPDAEGKITTAAKKTGIKGTETARLATEQPKESVEQKTTEESKTKSEPAPPIVEEENKKKPTFLTRTSEFLGFGEGGLYGNLTKDRNATSGILTSPQNILIAFIVAIANLFSGGRAVAPESKSDIDVTPTQPPTSQQEQTPQEVSIGHLKPTPTPTQLATTRAVDNGRFA